MSSFVELYCQYFDDLALGDGLDRAVQQRLISPEEATAITSFHALARQYKAPNGDDYDHVAILEDANWRKVITAAQQARLNLLPLLQELSERQILN